MNHVLPVESVGTIIIYPLTVLNVVVMPYKDPALNVVENVPLIGPETAQ